MAKFLLGMLAGLGLAGLGFLGLANGGAAAEEAEERPAYLVVLGTVHDREAFMSGYAAKLGPVYGRYGGQYLGLGPAPTVLEGEAAYGSYVLARWPSMEAAQKFWNSPEYDELRRARIDGEWGTFDVLLLEGLPQ